MKVRTDKITKTKRTRIKRYVIVCLASFASIGLLSFYTVKTNASATVSSSQPEGLTLAIRETELQQKTVNIINEYSAKKSVSKKEKEKPPKIIPPQKTVYLTFDDGPSNDITPQILNILNEYGLKASFFVIGSQCSLYPDMLRKESKNGNTICNHTYSHKYRAIYSSISNFDGDVKKCSDEIKYILGGAYSPKYVRFPGGGFGKKYISFRNSVQQEGYVPVNWNIDTGDSLGKNVPSNKLIANVKYQLRQVPKGHSVIVLMHDMTGKQTTVEALPSIIQYLKSQGYAFAKFD